MKIHLLALAAAAVLAGAPCMAVAHVVVVPNQAAPGATVTLNFVVGHGCEGQPTTALRVELPKTVSSVEPPPKGDWTPTLEPLPDGGLAVTWRGGAPLTKADGFAVKVRLPSQGTKVSFVALQSCGETTVRWDEPVPAEGPKPKHPAPTLTLAAAGTAVSAPMPSAAEGLPKDIQRRPDGGLADARGLALYTFDYDTMVGMSHCEEDCATMWPPVIAPQGAKPFADWTLVRRMDGSAQWALRDKPLYTYSGDRPGQPPHGLEVPNWRLAK